MKYPKSLENLISSFEKYPGIGHKTAEKLAIYTLTKLSKEDTDIFAESLQEIQTKVKRCPICGSITEGDVCSICKDPSRDSSTIMVVEDIKDVFVFENLHTYQGLYHVLNGAISFKNGISVEDLNIDSLVKRVLSHEEIKEIILATSASVEGETTAKYIRIILSDFKGVISRIAYGLPVGGSLEYADELTIEKAMEGRRQVNTKE